jgi:hypothetical protein
VTDTAGRNWVEIGATVLLALAAVATAWSSYQAARWNGEQAKASSAVNKARIDAARASDRANALTEVATFSRWVDAYARNEAFLAEFYPQAISQGIQARCQRLARDETAT